MTHGFHRLVTRSVLAVAWSSLPGCGGAAAASEPDLSIEATWSSPAKLSSGDGPTATLRERTVRGAGVRLWLGDRIVAERRDGSDVLVLHGRTSGRLAGGAAFADGRPSGTFRLLSPHAFEATWTRSELAPLAFGSGELIRLDLRRGPDHADRIFVRILAQPRLEGSSEAVLTPSPDAPAVLVGGKTVVRLTGRASEKLYDLHVLIGGSTWVPRRLLGDTGFEADLTAEQALASIGAPISIAFESRSIGGSAQNQARLVLSVARVDVTGDDPAGVFGPPDCTPRLRSCLTALPPGTLDLGPCGCAREVAACAGEIGARIATEDVDAAVARAHAVIADPGGFGRDAVALIGHDRLDAFVASVEGAAVGRLREMTGLWLLSPASVTAALDAEVEAVLDETYATPLQLAPALAPVPGDLQRQRDMGTDGLLSYLAAFDFVHSELDGPLPEIVARFRAAHVDSLRTFRQSAVPDPSAGDGRFDVLIGHWLSPTVEIWVDRSTGALDHVLFEID